MREIRGWPIDRQKAMLKAAGVTVVYVNDLPGALRSLRPTDKLVVAGGLRVLGDNRKEITFAIAGTRERRATVMDAETGREAGNDNGVALIDEAIAKIRGEKTIPNTSRAKRMQALAVAKRIRGRMLHQDALVLWRDPEMDTNEAIAAMIGWTHATAYRMLGPRGVRAGRKPAGHKRATRLQKQKQSEIGAVYFIRAGDRGPIKIGYATDVQARIKDLQVGHHKRLELLNFIEGKQKDEALLHKQFARYRLDGEWFRVAGHLKNFLASLPPLPPPAPVEPKKKAPHFPLGHPVLKRKGGKSGRPAAKLKISITEARKIWTDQRIKTNAEAAKIIGQSEGWCRDHLRKSSGRPRRKDHFDQAGGVRAVLRSAKRKR